MLHFLLYCWLSRNIFFFLEKKILKENKTRVTKKRFLFLSLKRFSEKFLLFFLIKHCVCMCVEKSDDDIWSFEWSSNSLLRELRILFYIKKYRVGLNRYFFLIPWSLKVFERNLHIKILWKFTHKNIWQPFQITRNDNVRFHRSELRWYNEEIEVIQKQQMDGCRQAVNSKNARSILLAQTYLHIYA